MVVNIFDFWVKSYSRAIQKYLKNMANRQVGDAAEEFRCCRKSNRG
jgi:hypothetical protein